jgi:hypothetical protein
VGNLTLSTVFIFIAILVFIIGVIFAIRHFLQRQREEALSDILIMSGLELIITSFGTFDDKLFAFLRNTDAQNNYVQLVVGIILLSAGIGFLFYIKNRLYILNINGYFDRRIEQHHHDLNLSTFEFKEREIDFKRLFRKSMDNNLVMEIQEEISEKISAFKNESKDKSRAYTGIAPIPFIFFAGKLFTREKIDRYFEYDKFNSTYYSLTLCKSKRKPYTPLQLKTPINLDAESVQSEEVVLAVSVSQSILDSHLTQFTCPIIHMSINEPTDNAIRYTDQLESYTKALYDTLIDIPSHFPNIKRIHLLYSGQSCLAFETGKLIDDQRMVEIINYHYVQTDTPKYPWGIILNGEQKGTLIKS